MKRPSLQFYPADWRNNAKLRRCSDAARGAWMDILCLLHDSDEYGVVRWPLVEVARAAGVAVKLAKELARNDVLKGSDAGDVEYVHTPRHAGKDGEPVTLVSRSDAPVWYSSRLVRDEWTRTRRGAGTRFDSDRQPSRTPIGSPTRRIGGPQGYGPSSASSASCSLGSSQQAPEVLKRAEEDLARACHLMSQAGIEASLINSSNKELKAAIEEGVTPEALADTAKQAVAQRKTNPFAWAIAAARGRHNSPVVRAPSQASRTPEPRSLAHRLYVPEKRSRRDPSAGAPEEFSKIISRLGIGSNGGGGMRPTAMNFPASTRPPADTCFMHLEEQ